MSYEKLPYDARVDERQAFFAKVAERRWDDYQKLREGPPQTIASRHNAHEAKYDQIERELRAQLDRHLPLPPPVFESDVLSTFLCPIVAVFQPKEISNPSLAYDEWQRQFASLKQTMAGDHTQNLVASWFVDTGPQRYDNLGGRVIAGFDDQSSCDRVVELILSAYSDFLDSCTNAPTTKLVVEGSAEATGIYRGHDQYGNVTLRVESNPSLPKLSLDFREDAHGLPVEFARSIMEGIRYSASFGLGIGLPVVGAKIRVIAGKWHEMDSRPCCYVHAAARAFQDALKQLECRPIDGSS